jgi:hypothetical protein
MAKRAMTNWVYTDNRGDDYQYKTPADVVVQLDGANVKVGGRDFVTGDGTLPKLPKNIKPRYATMISAGNSPRRVILFDKTCPLYANQAGDLTLPVYNDADGATYSVHSITDEARTQQGLATT